MRAGQNLRLKPITMTVEKIAHPGPCGARRRWSRRPWRGGPWRAPLVALVCSWDLWWRQQPFLLSVVERWRNLIPLPASATGPLNSPGLRLETWVT